MYASKYVSNKEVTGLYHIIENARYAGLPPPVLIEQAEEETILETLLRESVTAEEHTLLCLIDALVDEAWRFKSGKALRGELRRMFREMGLSNRRFYAAFHGIEKRMCL